MFRRTCIECICTIGVVDSYIFHEPFLKEKFPRLLQSVISVITKCDKCYYKVRQLILLQSATAYFITVTKCDSLFYYKVRQVLKQSATNVITKYHSLLLQSATAYFITKCHSLLLQSATTCSNKVPQFYYKVRQNSAFICQLVREIEIACGMCKRDYSQYFSYFSSCCSGFARL